MMKAKLKKGILLVLHAWDRMPMPEASVISAVQAWARPDRPTEGDIADALKDVEAEGYAAGVTDEFTRERSWTLTQKGEHQARQLR